MMKEYLINNKKFRLNIFDKIENHHQAYLLGYLLGDGNYHSFTNKRKARLGVTSSYRPTIDYFVKTFCPDNTINSTVPTNTTEGYNIKTDKLTYKISFSSLFSDTFEKYGILNRKIDRKIKNIPEDFFISFLLGLFDADGFMSWGRRKDRNRLWAKFVITHQSEQVLNFIKEYLESKFGYKVAVKKRKVEKCIDLSFSKRESVYEFYDYLYSNSIVEYNLVKHEKWKNYLAEWDKSRPIKTTYVGTRLLDNHEEEIVNQAEFCRKYNLDTSSVSSCIRGNYKQHKGWIFKTKEHKNDTNKD